MSNEELKKQIQENRDKHVKKVLALLNEDPDASQRWKEHEGLKEYLHELIEKDESLLLGIIGALEMYLDK